MKDITVFYGKQIYGKYDRVTSRNLMDMPDGVYIYWKNHSNANKCWYLKDLTPVLLEDVPKSLRALALILNL